MKQFIAAAFALAALTGAAAAEESSLSGFTSIEAEGLFKVEVGQGEAYSVNLTGAQMGSVSVRVHDGTLRVWQNDQNWLADRNLLDAVVHVTTPTLQGLKATRGARVEVNARRVDSLAVEAATGGVAQLTGSCERISAKASTGGQIVAQEFRCDELNAEATTGGSIQAQARRSVTAKASMGGDIDITGDPQRRASNTSMGGDITFHD